MVEPRKPLSYADSGVDYEALDRFKRLAQVKASATASNVQRLGFSENQNSRGESVYLLEDVDFYLAHVEEGLGTKILVADAMRKFTDVSYYVWIAQDTVAMIVNDMVTLGALPLSVAMHLAVGHTSWFDDEVRSRDIVNGWQSACNMAGAVWAGGETPTLQGVIYPDTALLGGSAMGIISPKDRIIAGDIQSGDVIIMLTASGIHANGLTLARKIAESLGVSAFGKGYLTTMPNGRSFGATLLDPTPIYVPHVAACLNAGIRVHYCVNITGHGWRKLMRHPGNFAYVVERLPPQLQIFEFIQAKGPVTNAEAYSTFNMGAGFALYVHRDDADRAVTIINKLRHSDVGVHAFRAGRIESSDQRKVVIRPVDLVYEAASLRIR